MCFYIYLIEGEIECVPEARASECLMLDEHDGEWANDRASPAVLLNAVVTLVSGSAVKFLRVANQ